jgi:hypothetical protein
MIQLTYSCQCTQNSISNLCNRHDTDTAEILKRDKDSLSKVTHILVHGTVFRHETSNYVLNIICFISISTSLQRNFWNCSVHLFLCMHKKIHATQNGFSGNLFLWSCNKICQHIPNLFKSNSASKHFTWQPPKISALTLTQNYFNI